MSTQPTNSTQTPAPLAWLTPTIRAWLYGIVTAAVPLLVVYGVLDEQTAPLWIALTASVLSTATALAHTPTKTTTEPATQPTTQPVTETPDKPTTGTAPNEQ